MRSIKFTYCKKHQKFFFVWCFYMLLICTGRGDQCNDATLPTGQKKRTAKIERTFSQIVLERLLEAACCVIDTLVN